MGVYIDMEMPDFGYVCLKVFANGDVFMTKMKRGALVVTGISDRVGTAVPVPPHGKLIDADAVSLDGGPYEYDEWCKWALEQYLDAPTVIPAEEGEI